MELIPHNPAVKLNSGKTQTYGFGWFLGETRGHRLIEHGGAWQGFNAHISIARVR